MHDQISPHVLLPFLAHSGGRAGLVGVDVVAETGYKRKRDRRLVDRRLHGCTRVINTCKEPRTKDRRV